MNFVDGPYVAARSIHMGPDTNEGNDSRMSFADAGVVHREAVDDIWALVREEIIEIDDKDIAKDHPAFVQTALTTQQSPADVGLAGIRSFSESLPSAMAQCIHLPHDYGHSKVVPQLLCHIPRTSAIPPSQSIYCELTLESDHDVKRHRNQNEVAAQSLVDVRCDQAILSPPSDGSDGCSMKSKRPEKRDDTWSRHYDQMLQFRAQFGHCIVPSKNTAKGLHGWVKRQRYNYERWKMGKSSALTVDRIKALEEVGFSWSVRSTMWESRFKVFKGYVKLPGHDGNKSANSAALIAWAKRQRRDYRRWLANGESAMTEDRYVRLTSIGFQWTNEE